MLLCYVRAKPKICPQYVVRLGTLYVLPALVCKIQCTGIGNQPV
jgi:hypothetical protein